MFFRVPGARVEAFCPPNITARFRLMMVTNILCRTAYRTKWGFQRPPFFESGVVLLQYGSLHHSRASRNLGWRYHHIGPLPSLDLVGAWIETTYSRNKCVVWTRGVTLETSQSKPTEAGHRRGVLEDVFGAEKEGWGEFDTSAGRKYSEDRVRFVITVYTIDSFVNWVLGVKQAQDGSRENKAGERSKTLTK